MKNLPLKKINNYFTPKKILTILTTMLITATSAANAQTPRQIREFQEQQNNLPKIEQIQKINEWITQSNISKLEKLIGNERLRAASNGTIQTYPTTGIGSIEEIDGKLYVNISMVGDQDYRYETEKKYQLPINVTWPNIIDYLKLTDEEAKELFSLNNPNTKPEDVVINRDDQNRTINIYASPSEITTTRRLRDGTEVTHDRWMPSRQLQKDSPYSHIIKVPMDKLLQTMLDYDPKILQELQRKDVAQKQALEKIQNYLDDCEEKSSFLQEVTDSLETKTKELEQTKDSTQQVINNVQEIIRKRELIIKAGIQAYNQNTPNTTQLIYTPELGIYGVIGKTGVGLVYALPINEELFEGIKTETGTEPNRPVMARQTTTKEIIEKHSAQIFLGRRLGDNLTAFLAAGGSIGQETTIIQDYFWTELPGPNNTTHVVNEHMDSPMRIIKDFTKPKFDLGLRYQSLDKVMGLHAKIGTDLEKTYFSAGVSINLGRSSNSNNNRTSTPNNQNNQYTAPDANQNQTRVRRTQNR